MKGEKLAPEVLLKTLYEVYIKVESLVPENFKVLGKVPMKKTIPGIGKSLLDMLKDELEKKGYEVPSDLELFYMLWDLHIGKYADVRRRLTAKYPRLRNYYFEPGLSWKHEWYVSL